MATAVTLNPAAPVFIPIVGGLATLEAYQLKQERAMQLRQMVYEEEWNHRCAKRAQEIVNIKSLVGYKLYAAQFPREHRDDEEPRTPDPYDRTVSKRKWKWTLDQWRQHCRYVYSRAVLLQCRELAFNGQASAPAATEAAEEDVEESASAASSDEDTGDMRSGCPEPLKGLRTLAIHPSYPFPRC